MQQSTSYSDSNAKKSAYDAPQITFRGSGPKMDAHVPPTLGLLPLTGSVPAHPPPAVPPHVAARVDARGFVSAPDIPTWSGTEGVRFDFNDGCRVLLPEGDWTVRLRDTHTDTPLFDTQIGAGFVASTRKHFVPFSIEISVGTKLVFKHQFDAHGRPVLIQFESNSLGDALGWFGYAVKFQRQHRCKLTCSMPAPLIALLRPGYPDIDFVTPDLVKPERYYATYRIGHFFGVEAAMYQPCAPQLVGRHRSAAYMLSVDPREAPPRIDLADDSRPLAGRYVCVAAQSAQRCARWERPGGWRELRQFLAASGYRIVCIDSPSPEIIDESSAIVETAHCLPPGTLWTERARWLRHADFFIGVSGDFSWLAWAVGTPTVLISGFTHPISEFETSYRIVNYHACNGCWNDRSIAFEHDDASACPRHAGTLRQFECARLISAEQIKDVIRQIQGLSG
ncbi:autotransporter strand-loop-strand O-heptosyltransferase [Burkholderia pyrrocinia]